VSGNNSHKMTLRPPTLTELEHKAKRGRKADVDFLMAFLAQSVDFMLSKKVDYALSQVASTEGQSRIRHFLFNGVSQTQRNYAALYFKRRGLTQILEEAVERGCIDSIQAYSR